MESFISLFLPFKTNFDEISDRAIRKKCLRRVTSIARENSKKIEFDFYIRTDDRGPGPLSSVKIWKKYF